MDKKKEQSIYDSGKQQFSNEDKSLDYFEKTDVLRAPIDNDITHDNGNSFEENYSSEKFKRNVHQSWSTTATDHQPITNQRSHHQNKDNTRWHKPGNKKEFEYFV